MRILIVECPYNQIPIKKNPVKLGKTTKTPVALKQRRPIGPLTSNKKSDRFSHLADDSRRRPAPVTRWTRQPLRSETKKKLGKQKLGKWTLPSLLVIHIVEEKLLRISRNKSMQLVDRIAMYRIWRLKNRYEPKELIIDIKIDWLETLRATDGGDGSGEDDAEEEDGAGGCDAVDAVVEAPVSSRNWSTAKSSSDADDGDGGRCVAKFWGKKTFFSKEKTATLVRRKRKNLTWKRPYCSSIMLQNTLTITLNFS